MTAKKKLATDIVDKSFAKTLASATLRPSVNAAAVIVEYASSFGEQDIESLMNELVGSIEKVNDGDMKRCEGMLMGQAYALQAIFMNLSRRAIVQDQVKHNEMLLRLALKAQGQCRATLETLSNIKNPPVVFAKQANINNGNQQINNGVPAPQAEKTVNEQNELLEAQHGGMTLDTGATGATIEKNKAMAALE